MPQGSWRPPTPAARVLPPEGEDLPSVIFPLWGKWRAAPKGALFFLPTSLVPAKAGTQTLTHRSESIIWIPAFAGNAVVRDGDERPYPFLALSLWERVG